VMERLIRSMGPGTMAVLDLEDGYLDVWDPGMTSERRARGREQLLELCANAKGRTNGRSVAMRVNVAGSEDFARDLPVVRAASETFGLAAVMLPKVESADQVRRALADLGAEGLEFGGLVPMVETRKGMDRIDEIVAAAVEVGSPAVVYGHHDYLLDAGAWPFPGPRDVSYWEPVERVAQPALAAGLRYVHPPEAELRDEVLLAGMVARLRQICGHRFDVMSAGMSQTSLLLRLVEGFLSRESDINPASGQQALTRAEKRSLAEKTRGLFEKNNRQEHSFSADSRQGRFISPHEYLAAKNYLREFADA
ncbi:MAG: aldolase/citrate lyase family protein, partial [Chthoniobacterales bacterium]